MTYSSELTASYSEIRRRLWGRTERRALHRPAPEPVPEPPPASKWEFRPKTQWQRIACEVCDKHGIPFGALLIPAKGSRVQAARCEAWWRIREEMRVVGWDMKPGPPSYVRIGKWFKRDHSTIVHGVQRYKKMIEGRSALDGGERG